MTNLILGIYKLIYNYIYFLIISNNKGNKELKTINALELTDLL